MYIHLFYLQLEWEHKWSEILREPELTNEGVRFWTTKQKSIKSIFGNSDNGKILLVDNNEVRKVRCSQTFPKNKYYWEPRIVLSCLIVSKYHIYSYTSDRLSLSLTQI